MVGLMAALLVGAAAPSASAHGDNDARLLMRNAEAGPYTFSLWQVVGEHGSELPPHLIVMFSGEAPAADDELAVLVGSRTMPAHPSSSTPDDWETASSVAGGETVSILIETAAGRWQSPTVTVPALVGSQLPMVLIISFAIVFTAAMAYWLATRTSRVWRSKATGRGATTELGT